MRQIIRKRTAIRFQRHRKKPRWPIERLYTRRPEKHGRLPLDAKTNEIFYSFQFSTTLDTENHTINTFQFHVVKLFVFAFIVICIVKLLIFAWRSKLKHLWAVAILIYHFSYTVKLPQYPSIIVCTCCQRKYVCSSMVFG